MAEPVEVDLHCPHCRYNLRGLPEDRCPECGRPFDRAELARLADLTPREPLDDEGGRLRPARIARLAATAPRKLARLVPPRPEGAHGAACSVMYYGWAVATLMIGGAGLYVAALETDVIVPAIAASLGMAFSAWLCETVTAALLALIVRPFGVPSRYRFWRAMTHYTGGFLVLTAGAVVLVNLSVVVASGSSTTLTELWLILCWLCVPGSFGWWTVALGTMILTRAEPGGRAWLGAALVPLVGFAAILCTPLFVASCLLACPMLVF